MKRRPSGEEDLRLDSSSEIHLLQFLWQTDIGLIGDGFYFFALGLVPDWESASCLFLFAIEAKLP